MLIGKKSSSKMLQKGYIKVTRLGNPTVTYQLIKILTKNKKYKIKLVRLSLADFKNNKISYKNFKGYGKNNLKIQLRSNTFVGEIKVYYY